jgi:hypothetical protein
MFRPTWRPSSGLQNAVPSWSCLKAVIKPGWHIPVPNVQWKTPDDGQRNCPKQVEFLDKNKFGKLVRLLVLLKRNLLRCMVTWTEKSRRKRLLTKYRISRPIRRTFFPEKCDLNSTCVLCAEGKYYFQTYKYPYSYYATSLSWDSEIFFQIMRSGITACERLTFL